MKIQKNDSNQIISKNHIHVAFGVLGLTDRTTIHGKYRKSVLPLFFDFVSLFNAKRLSIKMFLEIALVS